MVTLSHQKGTQTESWIQANVLYPADENDFESQDAPNEIQTEEFTDKNGRGFGNLIFLVISLVMGIVKILFFELIIKHCFRNTLIYLNVNK